ncbi:hypothetical protein [Lysinibacillus sp. SGAir0095]|uniref:hypothetical protein n=1 Tax=Lysinibacillus sp. SGAir0095 TaxID=2070463 RepID=UPI0010CCCB14|nr:hypothetical protein [Lysinibacillus sp. SGAir0095]QCR32283.1 hypothetical protein C1N55_08890 [Lysinibacillus sp. SGAir0095]
MVDKFTKWFIVSFVLGIISLILAFFVQDIARLTGEFNRNMLLVGTITIFILIITSLFSLVKANIKRIKGQIAVSLLFAVIPFSALLVNGLIFTVYFVGKWVYKQKDFL